MLFLCVFNQKCVPLYSNVSSIPKIIIMKKIFLSLLLLAAVSANAQNNPVLTIEGGQVQGVLADDHPDVFVYRGIPYAAPPIRENRWKEPQPIVPWKGVKICDTFGRPSYQAIQYTGGYYTEWGYGKEAAFSEDCLYLNVWTKAPGQVNKKLPVALWIHGGGYREGSDSSYILLCRQRAHTRFLATTESSTRLRR